MNTISIVPKRSLYFFLKDIKFSHTIFSLPFALSMFFLDGNCFPSFAQFFLILICMFSARSFAMGMNRYFDAAIDLKNPRTQNRMIPSGKMRSSEGLWLSLFFGGIFFMTASFFNLMTGILSLLVLLVLAIYPFCKRFTFLTHYFLGFCLGMVPMAVSMAMTEAISQVSLFLSAAVLFWVAGFDVLYALLDVEFDRKEKVFSIPARFGEKQAVWISRLSFMFTLFFLGVIGVQLQLGSFYFGGLLVITSMMVWEHMLVQKYLVSKNPTVLNQAFFNTNAMIGVVYFLSTLVR